VEDAALELGGLVAEGSSVEGVGNDPEGFGADGGRVDFLGVAAGEGGVGGVADEQDREGALGDGAFGRDFRDGEAGEGLAAEKHDPGSRSEERFAEPGKFLKAGVIVGSFTKAGEGRFGDDGFDARVDAGGLQGNPGAHGFTKSENVRGMFRGDERVEDGARVVAFEPAVGGHGASTFAVGAGVHQYDIVTGTEEEQRVFEDADAIVGDAVKNKNPRAVGLRSAHLPAAKKNAIGSGHGEGFAKRADLCEGGVGLLDEVGGERASNGMKEGWSDKPADDAGDEYGSEEKREGDAEESAGHGGP